MKALENKVAIITGAGSGIGTAAALLYVREGAKVVVSDIADKNGNVAVAEIKKNGGGTLFIRADSSSPVENKSLVDRR